MPIKYMSLEWRPLGNIRVLDPSESNIEVDLTSYYRESTELQHSM